MTRTRNLVGERFCRLVVLSKAVGTRASRWRCRCDCGNETEVVHSDLLSAHTRSCGCLHSDVTRQISTTHGKSHSRAYHTWTNMWARCGNPNSADYHRYGGRGIAVCDRWQSFEVFYSDMGDPPPGRTLDRRDNDRGYSPDNCHWATVTQQNRNRVDTIFITIHGTRKSLPEWCEIYAIAHMTAYRRYARGMDPVEAVTRPVRQVSQAYRRARPAFVGLSE